MLSSDSENWGYLGWISLAVGLIIYSLVGVTLAKYNVILNHPKILDQSNPRINSAYLHRYSI